ncbi:MAG: DUF3857 domain-containing protein [Dysgonamonadaceae bacterium]|jgi:predicted Zn-dependent protease|nr:DUF3857 domain-containing protein [Dysgonamonadaceae bacterium]
MNKKIFLILGNVLLFLCFSLTTTFAVENDNYSKGWAEFINNNRTEARQFFELAAKDAGSQQEAFLSMALLDWNESNEAGAFANFKKFYENSDNPYPYLYALFSLLYSRPNQSMSDVQRNFYERIVTDENMNGTLKAMIYQNLGNYYLDCNKQKKAQEFYAKIEAISQWQVLGTFDNVSGSGFDKNWGALDKARTSDVFKNKVNADIQWYTPVANKPDFWFYFDYYFTLNSIIAYAQSFVNSPVDQEVYLRAGTSGSLKIWVNDALIAAIPEERNCDMDIYAYKIKLNAGANRILVQIGQSEIDAANFLLRLTDEQGNPIQGITNSTVYADYEKSGNQTVNAILPFFAEQYFEDKVKAEPDNLLNYIALSETYLRNDKSYESIHTLKAAEQLAPRATFIHSRLTEAYIRSNNITDYSREMENIKQYDPTSFIALRDFYQEAIDSEKYSEAEKIAAKIKELYGTSRYTDEMELELASYQKRRDDLIQLGKNLYKKYPYNYSYMNLNVAIEENLYNDTKAAISILEDYCKKYLDTRAIGSLSDKYFNLGKTDKALELLRKRIDYLPYATGFLYNYATVLQRLQKYKEALAVMEEVKKQAPYMSYIYNNQGYIYKEIKDFERAKENFTKSIYYGPTSYDSRTQLRLLDNKKEVFDLFPKNDLNAMIAQAPAATDYPEDNALIILSDEQLVFYPEGAQEHRTEIAIKMLNQSAIEYWKEYKIGYNSNNQKLILDKYEVIKANGQKIKAETDGEFTVVFTNLEVGDVLHLDYRIQDFFSGVLSKHFYDWALMQYSLPTLYSRYAILIPSEKKFNYLVKNGNIEPEITDIENMKLYQWISTNQQAIKDEPYMSPIAEVVPVLIFSSIPDWKFVGDWYKDLTENKINAHSDYILKETYKEILKGKEDAAPIEKARLFYEYILKNITYSNVSFLQGNFIPQKASRTITTRLGDCKDVSTLFVALCREAGINANLVLLNSRENGKNMLALPSNNFNHCIAQLIIDDKTYYLELTNSKLPFGASVENNIQAGILPIPYKDESIGSELLEMDMPLWKLNEIIRNKTITLNGNNMQIKSGNIRTGELAAYYRYRYENMGEEERLKDMQQLVASDWKNPVKVSNLVFTNLDNLSDSISYHFDYEVTGALQDVADMKIFKLPWSDNIESASVVALDERKYPFELWQYVFSSEYEQITLFLPAGKQFAEIPTNIHLECAAASYELKYTLDAKGSLIATRTFKKKKEIVLPEEYAEFKDFINAASSSDGKQYAIK